MKKPQIRSPLRMWAGRYFFTLSRILKMHFSGEKYSQERSNQNLPILVIEHQSLLFKNLKKSDEQLQKNKVKNLEIAISKINGIILKPNEVFSFWHLIGKPTPRKGYLPGMILINGKIGEEVGGGLCQLSNLIHWMALHTDLSIVERWRHAYDVFPDENRTVPFGSGATVAYNYIDLQIKNTTPHRYQFKFYLSEKFLEGEIRCSEKLPYQYKVFEKNSKIVPEIWGGHSRHNQIYKQKYQDEVAISEELFVCENHAFLTYNPEISEGSQG